MPLYLAAGGKLEDWLVSCAIDRHRTNSRILKKVFRLTDSSDLAAVLRVHAAAITDNYWVRSDREETLSYENVRFTDDTFAEVALTGSFSSYSKTYDSAQIAAGSPELTNIGSYEKCWRVKNGHWYLYKSGTPLERFSEIFIARLGTALGFAMAEYAPEAVVREIAQETLPEADIERNYVVEMVLERGQRLKHKLERFQQLNGSGPTIDL